MAVPTPCCLERPRRTSSDHQAPTSRGALVAAAVHSRRRQLPLPRTLARLQRPPGPVPRRGPAPPPASTASAMRATPPAAVLLCSVEDSERPQLPARLDRPNPDRSGPLGPHPQPRQPNAPLLLPLHSSGQGPCPRFVATVMIRSTTWDHLYHGHVLLPSAIPVAGAGNVMI
ncbi:hypothetical protein VPH35_036813 [Triticum aestivum]